MCSLGLVVVGDSFEFRVQRPRAGGRVREERNFRAGRWMRRCGLRALGFRRPFVACEVRAWVADVEQAEVESALTVGIPAEFVVDRRGRDAPEEEGDSEDGEVTLQAPGDRPQPVVVSGAGAEFGQNRGPDDREGGQAGLVGMRDHVVDRVAGSRRSRCRGPGRGARRRSRSASRSGSDSSDSATASHCGVAWGLPMNPVGKSWISVFGVLQRQAVSGWRPPGAHLVFGVDVGVAAGLGRARFDEIGVDRRAGAGGFGADAEERDDHARQASASSPPRATSSRSTPAASHGDHLRFLPCRRCLLAVLLLLSPSSSVLLLDAPASGCRRSPSGAGARRRPARRRLAAPWHSSAAAQGGRRRREGNPPPIRAS